MSNCWKSHAAALNLLLGTGSTGMRRVQYHNDNGNNVEVYHNWLYLMALGRFRGKPADWLTNFSLFEERMTCTTIFPYFLLVQDKVSRLVFYFSEAIQN